MLHLHFQNKSWSDGAILHSVSSKVGSKDIQLLPGEWSICETSAWTESVDLLSCCEAHCEVEPASRQDQSHPSWIYACAGLVRNLLLWHYNSRTVLCCTRHALFDLGQTRSRVQTLMVEAIIFVVIPAQLTDPKGTTCWKINSLHLPRLLHGVGYLDSDAPPPQRPLWTVLR